MGHAVNGLHHVAVAKNGVDIYINLISSSAAENVSRQPRILTLAKELLATHNISGAAVEIEQDFGRIIGNSEVVETTAKDTILYAKMLKKDTYCRFVRKRQMAPSSYLSIIIRRNEDGIYELADVRVGRLTPPFPAEDETESDGKLYWENHAIVLEGQPLQLRTLTKTAPY